MKKFKLLTIVAMSLFYIYVGVEHFINPSWFVQIIPPFLPFHYSLVYISGFFEILFGILLLIPRFRSIAGLGLIMLLVAVYPANIYLAFNEEPQKALEISSFMASWVRLPIQFIFIALAYWHAKK